MKFNSVINGLGRISKCRTLKNIRWQRLKILPDVGFIRCL
ncbi:MAG: hypothetical protein ACI81T_002307, partial [Bacteroidia bacterium]